MKPTRKKILIIEDDADDLAIILSLLSPRHFVCQGTPCPMDGLEKTQSWQPNLIVLDLMLPKMSGIGFIREFKKRFAGSEVQIIVVTGLKDPEVELLARDLGVADFLYKDFMSNKLAPAVEKLVA